MKAILLIAAMILGTGAQAFAQETVELNHVTTREEARPAWVCGLAFEGESQGLQFIIGSFRTVAYGELNCTDGLGGEYHRPVRVSMGTKFISPAIGIGTFRLAGVSAEISLFNLHPDVLLGQYVVAQGQVAFVGGVAAFTAVKVQPPQIAAQVSIQLLSGFGAHLGFHKMTIEALN
ncbi:MAG: hypothetical protein KF681_16625 [Bdellovibrionaceae bacterium]|nr:hypothetical protein [Pseudobdellovibrionaceae bacterium]